LKNISNKVCKKVGREQQNAYLYKKERDMKDIKEIVIQEIIATLQGMEVDGETMQRILAETGMETQMLQQLVMTQPKELTEQVLEEKIKLFF
jgi:hypothetical protein